MKFQVKPILPQMADLYRMPRSQERFNRYLSMLQGQTKGDMVLPIAGYNPMGKEHVLHRIQELIDQEAESLINERLTSINDQFQQILPEATFEVVINLSDDLGGAWTDRFASHYTNTFHFGPIAKRNFCTPYFWTSDQPFDEQMIIDRSMEAVLRTIYFLSHGKPISLGDHVKQEIFVAQQIQHNEKQNLGNEVSQFFERNKNSEDYNLIFNFFYGDEASAQLGYQTFGHPELAGFKFANSNPEI